MNKKVIWYAAFAVLTLVNIAFFVVAIGTTERGSGTPAWITAGFVLSALALLILAAIDKVMTEDVEKFW